MGTIRLLLLSLAAGCGIGILFSWWRIPIPAPPPVGLIGLAGMTLGAFLWVLFTK